MANRKKILITYATAGIGHKKASLAISAALKKKNEDIDISLIDVLDYTNKFVKKNYPSTYLLLINKLIYLWGFLYYMLDFKLINALLSPFRRLYHISNWQPLVKFISDFKPDVIVSTHFVTADLAAFLRKKYNLKFKMVNIITDYRAHAFWIAPGIDKYIVAHEATKKDLVGKWKISPKNIEVMGIPVESRFSIEHDRLFFRKKLGIQEDSFTILFIGGGYGVGPIMRMLRILDKLDLSLTGITVCGHNESLYKEIEDFKIKSKINIINYGYTDEVDKLMAASDIYVGKAGGISSTESLAQDLPLLFIRPIPGQESRNAKLLIGCGAAFLLKNIKHIRDVIEDLKHSKKKLELAKENIRKIRKINASNDISDFLIRYAKGE